MIELALVHLKPFCNILIDCGNTRWIKVDGNNFWKAEIIFLNIMSVHAKWSLVLLLNKYLFFFLSYDWYVVIKSFLIYKYIYVDVVNNCLGIVWNMIHGCSSTVSNTYIVAAYYPRINIVKRLMPRLHGVKFFTGTHTERGRKT